MNIRKIAKRMIPRSAVSLFRQYRYKPYPMNWTAKERETALKELYFRKTGKTIDLDNVKTFNEKIQWLKLYWDHPDLSRIVCKYHFKQYIAEKLGEGYTIPLLGVWTNVDDIDWDSLPDNFVLKSNASSDSQGIKIIKGKSNYDFEQVKKEMAVWLDPRKTLINSFCRAYYNVTPVLIAEEYVEQVNNQLYDYKFFCFHGKPETAYVASDRFDADTSEWVSSRISLYNLSWERLDIKYGTHEPNDIPAPKRLAEMIEISEKLSKEFPFVRVDFFEVEEKLYLSELTFYPGGGFNQISEELSEHWSQLLELPPKQELGRTFKRKLY